MADSDFPEPFEKWQGPSYEEFISGNGVLGRWLESDAGKAYTERSDMEMRGEADHAEKWLAANQHLHDPEQVTKANRVITSGKRGLLTPGAVNMQMTMIFQGAYPLFDPRDVSNTIPDHLGDQFR